MPVKFKARLPRDVPAAAAVYELPSVAMSAASLRATAKSLGLAGTGGDVVTATDRMAYNEGRHSLTVQRLSGAVAFQHRDKYGREPTKPFQLTNRRADAAGRQFLTRTKIVPIASARLARVTHMNSAVGDVKTGEVRQQVIDAGVVYRRVIDELVVDGPGGFALVVLDPDAEVIGLRSIWRPNGRRLGKVKLKKPEQAVRELEEHASKLRGDVVVTKASLCYFELGPLDRQKVIEPAYAFVYVVQDGEVAMKSAFVTHAGDKTFGRLIGKKRFAAAQAPRRE
jgi:hypothetical protein